MARWQCPVHADHGGRQPAGARGTGGGPARSRGTFANRRATALGAADAGRADALCPERTGRTCEGQVAGARQRYRQIRSERARAAVAPAIAARAGGSAYRRAHGYRHARHHRCHGGLRDDRIDGQGERRTGERQHGVSGRLRTAAGPFCPSLGGACVAARGRQDAGAVVPCSVRQRRCGRRVAAQVADQRSRPLQRRLAVPRRDRHAGHAESRRRNAGVPLPAACRAPACARLCSRCGPKRVLQRSQVQGEGRSVRHAFHQSQAG